MQKSPPNRAPITYKRALALVIPICLLSLVLAAIVVSIANDMYAFVKPEREFVLSLDGSTDAEQLSKTLQKNGILKNDFMFFMYLRSKGKVDEVSSLHGTWVLNAKMSYREIVSELF